MHKREVRFDAIYLGCNSNGSSFSLHFYGKDPTEAGFRAALDKLFEQAMGRPTRVRIEYGEEIDATRAEYPEGDHTPFVGYKPELSLATDDEPKAVVTTGSWRVRPSSNRFSPPQLPDTPPSGEGEL